MKRKYIKSKYVFVLENEDGKKQFLHNTSKGIEVRNNIHHNILVIDSSDDILKQISAQIVANPAYKDFKKVAIEELTPKRLINGSSSSWFGRILKRLRSK